MFVALHFGMHYIKQKFGNKLNINYTGLMATVLSFVLANFFITGQVLIGLTDADIKKSQRYNIEKEYQKYLSGGLTPNHYNAAPLLKTDVETAGVELYSSLDKDFQQSFEQYQSSFFTASVLPVFTEVSGNSTYHNNISLQREAIPLFILFHSWKSHLS